MNAKLEIQKRRARKGNFWIPSFLIIGFFLLVVTACGKDSLHFECRVGVCVDLQVAQPVRAGVPEKFSIRVRTDKDVAGLEVTLHAGFLVSILSVEETPANAELTFMDDEDLRWNIDTSGGESYTFSGFVIFANPNAPFGAYYEDLISTAGHPSITRVTDRFIIYLTGDGTQVDEKEARKLMGTGVYLPIESTWEYSPSQTPHTSSPFPRLTPNPSQTIIFRQFYLYPTVTETIPAYPGPMTPVSPMP